MGQDSGAPAIERHVFRHDGLDFHGLAAGAGEPLVLVHGGGSRATAFAPVMPMLARRFRVHAYDQRGFGDTACTPGAAITHQMWADDLLALLDHLQAPRAFLCGWSLGATVTMNVASQHPDRVRALALLGAPHPDRPLDRAFFRRRLAQLEAGTPAEEIVDGLMGHVQAMFSPSSLKHGPGGPDTIREEQLANLRCAGQVTRAYETRPDYGPITAAIRCPVTLIVGADDRTCDLAGAQVMQSRLNDCRLRVIPDCGHYYTLEQPQAVAEALVEALDPA